MKNKKIVINIDMKNKRVRNGFVKSNIKKDLAESKKNSNLKKTKIHDNADTYENEKQKFNQDEIDEPVEIEYVKKSELEEITEGINIVDKHKQKSKIEREKRIGKTFNEVLEEVKNVDEEKNEINFGPIFLSVFAVFIVIAVYIFFEYGPILGISLDIAENMKQSKIDIVATDSDFYSRYNDELLVYSNQTLTTYNKNGKKTWEHTLDQMFTPTIYIEGRYMVVANNSSGNIYVFENKKEILNKKVDGVIDNIYIDESGYFAIEYASSGYKKIVGIFDKNGKNYYNTYLENDTIADIKLLENATKLLITKINTTSFKAGTEIVLVDSTNQEENIKSIAKLDNNLVYDLIIQGRNIIMLLDNKLVSVNIDTSEIKEIKNFVDTQILFFTLNENYYTCVEKKLGENKEYKINNVRFDGTIISEFGAENSPKFVLNSGLLTYFVYSNEYKAINKWGIELEKKDLENIPKDIIVFNNEKSLALIYTNVVHIVNL